MSIRKILSLLLIFGLLWPAGLLRAETFTLNFKDADIGSVINLVAKVTGKTFIVDPAVKGNVTIVSSKPLRADEVYAVFLSTLQVHDFAAVEAGKVIKIIPQAKAGQDLVIIDDEDQPKNLPADRIITRVHKLHNLQADKLVPILRPMLNTRAGQMSALAVKEGNALVITERAGDVERLLQIVRRLDQASAGGLEVMTLEHADAREVVSVLTGLEIGSGRLSADQLRLAADGRTNTILMQGDEQHLLRVKAMIIHLDTPLAKDGDTQVIFLRYAKAKDMVPILGGVELPEASRTAGAAGAAAAAGGSAQARRTTALQRGDVNIQADEGTNALIMTGPPAALQALQAVVRQLDVRRVQLMIEAVIAEVSTAKGVDLGIQWFAAEANHTGIIGGTNFPGSSLPLNKVIAKDNNSIDALAGVSGLTLGLFSGTTKILGTEFFSLGALINALASDTDTNILSTPSLVTMDNHEAEIIVGQNVPFLTGSFTQATTGVGGSPFQTIERRDVGIKLRVKPQVNEGDIIRLDIAQEVSSVEPGSLDFAAGLITNTRNITTSVLVEDGKVLVLGGLISDDVTEAVSKVPFLGDIPFLGALFRHTSTKRGKRNLMVFLRPVILRDQAMNAQVSLDKYDLIRGQQLERSRSGVKLMPGQEQPVLEEFDVFAEKHFLHALPPGQPGAEPQTAQ